MNSNKDFYLSKLEEHQTGPKAVGWDDPHRSVLRYDVVASQVKTLKHSDFHMIDFGCGMGELLNYLPEDIHYLGIDLMMEYIRKAQEAHSDKALAQFMIGDEDALSHMGMQVDLICCLGSFTLSLDDPENYTPLDTIRTLLNHTNRLIVTGYHQGCDVRDPKMYYHDIQQFPLLAEEKGFYLATTNALGPYEFTSFFTRKFIPKKQVKS